MKLARIVIAAVWLAAPGLALGQEATDEAPVPQVKCKDGTLSKAGRGACSGHGGTAKATAQPTKKTPVTVEQDKRVAPQTPSMGTAATVRCKDGTMSSAGQGSCSHHGGVDKNTGAAPQAVPGSTTRTPADTETRAVNPKGELTPNPPVKAPAPGQVTARCKDGTMSHSTHHSGTCSGHGGVEKWLDSATP
jgi:hypothetical protein